MRTSVKLVAIVAGCLVFLAAVFLVIGSGVLDFNKIKYNDDRIYTSGTSDFAANEVTAINMEWSSGDITIKQWEGSTVKVTLHTAYVDKERQVTWGLVGTTLTVRENWTPFFVSCSHLQQLKQIEILLPAQSAQNLGDVDLNLAAGDVSVSALATNNLVIQSAEAVVTLDAVKVLGAADISMARGNIAGTDFAAQYLRLNTASGTIDFAGRYGTIDAEAVSGTINLNSDVAPLKIHGELVSGRFDIRIPDNSGFIATLQAPLGSFYSDFDTTLIDNNVYSYLNGNSKYDFEVASGTVNIYRVR